MIGVGNGSDTTRLCDGWTEDRLGNVCSIEIGGTPSRSVADYWDEDKETENAWVSIKDMRRRVITETAEHISNAGIKNSNVKLQSCGTVLLSFKLTIGRVAIAGIPLYTNEAIAGLRPTGLSSEYLYHGLQHWDLLQGVDQAIKGATLNKKKLKRISFQYPKSEVEQAKIAEVLSTVDRAIEQTEALIAKQQLIKTGLMQDLLTRGIDKHGNLRSKQTHKFKDSPLGRIPVGWDAKKTQEVANKLWIGLVTTMTAHYVRNGVKLIRNQNIREDHIQTDEMINLSHSFADLFTNRKLRCGDVVTVHTGDVGTSAVIDELLDGSHGFATINTRVDLKVIDSQYLCWCFNSRRFKRQIALVVTGDGRDNLNLKDFIHLYVPVPKEISEQKRIAAILDMCKKRITNETDYLSKLKKNKTALMQDLLTGKRRVTRLLAEAEATA